MYALLLVVCLSLAILAYLLIKMRTYLDKQNMEQVEKFDKISERIHDIDAASQHIVSLDDLIKTTTATQALLGQVQQQIDSSNTHTVQGNALTVQSLTDTSQAVKQLTSSLEKVQHDLIAYATQTATQTRISQGSLEQIRKSVAQMNAVMVNKKARGSWGEYQLENLLAIYGGKSCEIWQAQYSLSTGVRADAILHVPSSSRVLCVDSKFPLEGFEEICAAQDKGDTSALSRARGHFVTSVTKHVKDIASKYIIADETADLAIMFIPSEAVYYEICSSFPELIDKAISSHVLITSPTTLVGIVFTFVGALRDVERVRNIDEIIHRITLLEDNAHRLQDRIAACDKSFATSFDKLHQAKISADKIATDIEHLSAGVIDSGNDDKSINKLR